MDQWCARASWSWEGLPILFIPNLNLDTIPHSYQSHGLAEQRCKSTKLCVTKEDEQNNPLFMPIPRRQEEEMNAKSVSTKSF